MTMGEYIGLVQTVADLSQPANLSEVLIEVRARYIWLVSVLLNTVVPLGAALVCGQIVYRVHGRGRLWGVVAIGVVLCLGAVAVLLESIATQGVLYRSVFGFTYLAPEASKRFTPAFLSYVHSLVSLMNGMAVTVPVIAVLAASSTLAPPPDKRPDDLGYLTQQMRSLKGVLYAGSAILVTGILHMGS